MSLFARSQSKTPTSAVGQTPAEIVAAVVTPGAETAGVHAVSFEEIVARYHGKVFQLVYRYTGDYEESCDLTQ